MKQYKIMRILQTERELELLDTSTGEVYYTRVSNDVDINSFTVGSFINLNIQE